MNPYSTVPGAGHYGARPRGVRWLRLLLLTDVPKRKNLVIRPTPSQLRFASRLAGQEAGRVGSQGGQMRTNVTFCSRLDYHGLRGRGNRVIAAARC